MDENKPAVYRQRKPAVDSDEIDMVELFQNLWQQKATIFVVALVCVMVTAVYLIFATPYYQVKSVLRPAAIKELDALNRTGLYELNSPQALRRVGAALASYDIRLNFYRANQELFDTTKNDQNSLEQYFEEFNEDAFKMLQPDPKKEQELSAYVGIQLSYPAGVDGVAVVNGLVATAVHIEREKISNDLKALIKNRLNQLDLKMIAARAKYEAEKEARIATLLEADSLKRATLQDELKALREKIKTQRMNRIEKLSEAEEIAKILGIKKPTTPSALGENGKVAQGNSFKAEINNQVLPLYFMGSETLEAERQTLLKRRSDDFSEPRIAEIEKELRLLEKNRAIETLNQRENEALFFEGQATLREEIARLRNIQTDLSDISLVTVDQQAVEPVAPVKPKKAIILASSIIVGGMLGVFIALIRSMLKRRAAQVG